MSKIGVKKAVSAFTLIEMVVVVILIGVIYSLLLFHKKPQKRDFLVNATTIYRAILYPFWNHSHVMLVCEDRCEKCFVYDDDFKVLKKDFDIGFDKNHPPKLYIFSKNSDIINYEPVQLNPKREGHKVCFRYDLYSNKSSTELFVEDSNGTVTYLPPYFDRSKNFASIEDAKSYFDDIKAEISR